MHAFVELGKGHASLERFSSFMNLPVIDSKTISQHVHHIEKLRYMPTKDHLVDVRRKVSDAHL